MLRASGQDGPCDVQAVMLDGIEDPQAGVRAVAGHEDHFHQVTAALRLVEPQERLHQFESGAGAQDVLFIGDLILRIGLQAPGLVDVVLLLQVEQGPGGDTDHQGLREIVKHGCLLNRRVVGIGVPDGLYHVPAFAGRGILRPAAPQKKALLHKQQRQNTKNRKNMVKKQTRDNKERVRGKE